MQSHGYRDVGHWFVVRLTFFKHFGRGAPAVEDLQPGPDIEAAMARARLRMQVDEFDLPTDPGTPLKR